ncbi:MAG: ABC transporter permease, partial [Planctomycetota bacterium]
VGLGSALAGFKAVATGSPFSVPLPLVAFLSGTSESAFHWTWIEFPFTGVLLAIVAVMAWVFLNQTVAGRHLLATGENATAARYSGVATDRLIVSAYVVSGVLAALAGILFLLEWNSVQPGSSGSFYELYAIAAAVLGGCSLRGGRGAVLGVIAGAAVMRCLYKAIVVLGIDQQWEMVIIGGALLGSVLVDEVIRRFRQRR